MSDAKALREQIVERLVAQADSKMEEEAAQYDDRLEQSIKDMRRLVGKKEFQEAAKIAYSIKGAAGTMGWPMASRAAGFLRLILDDYDRIPMADEAIRVHLDTLTLIFHKNLKGETQEGVELIKDLHALLLKYNITPGV